MPSIWHILLLLLVVVLIFGTSKLRSLGSDLGGAIRSFKKGMEEEGSGTDPSSERLKADPPPVSAVQQQRDTHEVE